MNYLPTTTLEIDTWVYIPLVLGISLALAIFTRSLVVGSKRTVIGYREVPDVGRHNFYDPEPEMKKVPIYDVRDPFSIKQNILRAWAIGILLLTIIPLVALNKSYEEIRSQAEQNVYANLVSKYEVEAVRKSALNSIRNSLDPLKEEKQYVAVKKNGEFAIYYLSQDAVTSEPFLYQLHSNEPALTELP